MSTKSFCLLLMLMSLLFLQPTRAKEIVPSHEWQRLGPTDSVPAGLEIRMDLDGGGTWVRIPPPTVTPVSPAPQHHHHHHRCGPSCHERLEQHRRRALRGGSAAAVLRNSGVAMANNSNKPSSEVVFYRILLGLASSLVVGLVLYNTKRKKLRDL